MEEDVNPIDNVSEVFESLSLKLNKLLRQKEPCATQTNDKQIFDQTWVRLVSKDLDLERNHHQHQQSKHVGNVQNLGGDEPVVDDLSDFLGILDVTSQEFAEVEHHAVDGDVLKVLKWLSFSNLINLHPEKYVSHI